MRMSYAAHYPLGPDGRQNGPLVPSARTQTHTHEDTGNTCKAQSPCLQPSLVQLTGKLIAPIEGEHAHRMGPPKSSPKSSANAPPSTKPAPR